jgi:mRNA-degrading endonuclease YafQ of YafQ-DinJ toxin-antitoxin module
MWSVGITSRAAKGKDSLPPEILINFTTLFALLERIGPAQPKWPHYGKLSGQKKEMHHCHLNKGRPTWVVIWTVLDKQKKIMEINYVGTHENAPY